MIKVGQKIFIYWLQYSYQNKEFKILFYAKRQYAVLYSNSVPGFTQENVSCLEDSEEKKKTTSASLSGI
jgi:hypothetical protein